MHAGNVLAEELDAAGGDAAVLEGKNARNSLERGGLAGAVRAEQRDAAAVRNGEREAAQRHDRAAIEHVEVFDFERGGHASSLLCPGCRAARRVAPLIRDRPRLWRSRVCTAPLRVAMRPGHGDQSSLIQSVSGLNENLSADTENR